MLCYIILNVPYSRLAYGLPALKQTLKFLLHIVLPGPKMKKFGYQFGSQFQKYRKLAMNKFGVVAKETVGTTSVVEQI